MAFVSPHFMRQKSNPLVFACFDLGNPVEQRVGIPTHLPVCEFNSFHGKHVIAYQEKQHKFFITQGIIIKNFSEAKVVNGFFSILAMTCFINKYKRKKGISQHIQNWKTCHSFNTFQFNCYTGMEKFCIFLQNVVWFINPISTVGLAFLPDLCLRHDSRQMSLSHADKNFAIFLVFQMCLLIILNLQLSVLITFLEPTSQIDIYSKFVKMFMFEVFLKKF